MNEQSGVECSLMDDAKTYIIFGLYISSSYQLPFASISHSAKVDIYLQFEFLPEAQFDQPESPGLYITKYAQEYSVFYRNKEGEALLFLVPINGKVIKVLRSFEEAHDSLAGLLGNVLPLLMKLRGSLLIHASALRAPSGVGFLVAGNSGAGKSTFTSMLLKNGASLLSDDCSLIDLDSNAASVRPGFPLLKLSLDTIEYLKLEEMARVPVFRTVAPNLEHWLQLEKWPGSYYDRPVEVRVIYLLSGREAQLAQPKIVPVTGLDKAQALMAHLYGNRLAPDQMKGMYEKCVQLAPHVRIAKVWLRDGLEYLNDSAQFVLEDLG